MAPFPACRELPWLGVPFFGPSNLKWQLLRLTPSSLPVWCRRSVPGAVPTELCCGFQRVVSNGSPSCQRREFRSQQVINNGSFSCWCRGPQTRATGASSASKGPCRRSCCGSQRVLSNDSLSCLRGKLVSQAVIGNGSFFLLYKGPQASARATGASSASKGPCRRGSVAAEDGSPIFRPLKPGRQQMRLTPSSLPVRCRCSVPIASTLQKPCAGSFAPLFFGMRLGE